MKLPYNEIMKPTLFYDPVNGEPAITLDEDWLDKPQEISISVTHPLIASSHYRAIYMDGDYIFLTPQSMGDVACIERCARACRNLEGEIAEAGVYFGSTARLILRFFDRTNKTIHLFDTFDVMPDANPKYDTPENWHPQKGLSVEFAKHVLEDYYSKGLVKFHKGLFKDTLHEAADKQFCFVHIDCDLYDGARDAIEFFYPRMVTGGVMMFHDYDTTSFPGIKLAVEEFFLLKSELRITNRYGSHHVVVKR